MKTIPVIGTLDDAGEAREYPATVGPSRVTRPAYKADQAAKNARAKAAAEILWNGMQGRRR